MNYNEDGGLQEKFACRTGPPIGAIRGTYQTALRCFCLRAEVLNGQGKGPGRRDQVDMQELSGSEPTDEVSKIT